MLNTTQNILTKDNILKFILLKYSWNQYSFLLFSTVIQLYIPLLFKDKILIFM